MAYTHWMLFTAVSVSAIIVVPAKAERINVKPSDCALGNADSTCKGAVVGGGGNGGGGDPNPTPLYNGPLARGPYLTGWEFWGYDFAARRRGASDMVSINAFRNASGGPIKITLSMRVPDSASCQNGCLPGIRFQSGQDLHYIVPHLFVGKGIASATLWVLDGDPYAWAIGLGSPSPIILTVTAPFQSRATMESAGLDDHPDVADPIQPDIYECQCWDGTLASCSIGTRYSNGLMSPWYPKNQGHVAPDAFNNCPPER